MYNYSRVYHTNVNSTEHNWNIKGYTLGDQSRVETGECTISIGNLGVHYREMEWKMRDNRRRTNNCRSAQVSVALWRVRAVSRLLAINWQ